MYNIWWEKWSVSKHNNCFQKCVLFLLKLTDSTVKYIGMFRRVTIMIQIHHASDQIYYTYNLTVMMLGWSQNACLTLFSNSLIWLYFSVKINITYFSCCSWRMDILGIHVMKLINIDTNIATVTTNYHMKK